MSGKSPLHFDADPDQGVDPELVFFILESGTLTDTCTCEVWCFLIEFKGTVGPRGGKEVLI